MLPLPEGQVGEAVIRRYLPSERWETAYAPLSAGHRLVAEYAGISVLEADRLPYPLFLLLRRDAWLYGVSQTEAGREALAAIWRLSRRECEWKGDRTIGSE